MARCPCWRMSQYFKFSLVEMNTGAHFGGLTQVCLRIARWILKNHLEGMQKMIFKNTGRFIPDRIKSDPKSTFSHPVSLPPMFKPKLQKNVFFWFWDWTLFVFGMAYRVRKGRFGVIFESIGGETSGVFESHRHGWIGLELVRWKPRSFWCFGPKMSFRGLEFVNLGDA